MNGYEWIKYHHRSIWKEIADVIAFVDITKHQTKESKEKTMLGKMLYSPKALNASMRSEFIRLLWGGK